ncbi:MAG: MaoC family dehydratase [Chloroflexi bacterium]|nr:MaoC family dehydratase [Chloroflexota bacterium]
MVTIAKGDIPVGLDLGSHEYEISPELAATYMAGVDDHHDWYTSESPFGAAVAPALLLHSEVYRFANWYLPNIYGNLHARQEWELFAPMSIGSTVTTHSTIVDRYVKRGRDYVVNEVQVFSTDGSLVCRGRTHQSFLLEVAEEELVFDQQREKSSKRRFEVGAGDIEEEIAPLEKAVTMEMMKTFSPGTSYHNDAEQAKKLGFPDIVVQGMMPICFLSELMTRRFGEGWYVGGRMSVNLVNVLWGGDGAATAKGVIREFTREGARRRAHCEIWIEKQDGTKVTVGSASAVV